MLIVNAFSSEELICELGINNMCVPYLTRHCENSHKKHMASKQFLALSHREHGPRGRGEVGEQGKRVYFTGSVKRKGNVLKSSSHQPWTVRENTRL